MDYIDIKESRQERDQEYTKKLQDDFTATLLLIEERLGVFYAKYGKDGVITKDEVEQYLRGSDLKTLTTKLNSYIKQADELGIKFDKDIENRISGKKFTRIEGLRLEIACLISLLFGEQEEGLRDHFSEQYIQSALMAAFIYYNDDRDVGDDWNELEDTMFSSWRDDQSTWDEQLWRRKRYLIADLNRQLQFGLINEQDFATIMVLIQKYLKSSMNGVKNNILIPDSTYFGNHGFVDMGKYLGYSSVIFCTIDDERRSVWCTEADSNIIPIDEIEYGVNAPPLPNHPCRSWLEYYE